MLQTLLRGGPALACLLAVTTLAAAEPVPADNPLFKLLTGPAPPRLIGYTPAELDPRVEANQAALKTSSIQADLMALRPSFDGLVLYGYHEACTPRITAVAKSLGYRVVLLAIWDPRSAKEIDGVAALAKLHRDDFAVGVLVGNEGLTFGRYEPDDLTIAAERLRTLLPPGVPIATSEPLIAYTKNYPQIVRPFGDFLAPNIHPVFDRPDASPAEAAAWAREQAATLARETGRPVILKETGFPHDGKPAYSVDSQRTFWAAYIKPGLLQKAGDGWAYHGVAFEAFDLPWKAEASGIPIEAHWGLFSRERAPYPAASVWSTKPAGDR